MTKYLPIEKKKITIRGENVLLRPARIFDAPRLARLLNEKGVKENLRDFGGTSKVASDILHNRKFWLVAQKGKELVGAMRMRPEEHPAACEFSLAFSQNGRGQGIASETLRHGTEWMRKNGFDNTTAYVGEHNTAVDFYKKNGFRIVAVIPDQYVLPEEFKTNGKKLGTSIVMQKKL